MHRDVVDAAAVDVDPLAQVLDGHGRAFDVPAGEPHAPGAGPFHLAFGPCRRELPQGEVGVVAFAGDHFDSRPGLQSLDVQPGQLAVVAHLRGVHVDAVAGNDIGVALALQGGDHLDLLGDVVGGLAPDVGHEDVQPLQIVREALLVELGDLPGALAFAGGALFHLVFAHVGVAGEVADVGNVHNVADPKTRRDEGSLENIFKNVRSQVADVRVVVHRQAASIEADGGSSQRPELVGPPRHRVVQRYHARSYLSCHTIVRGFVRYKVEPRPGTARKKHDLETTPAVA